MKTSILLLISLFLFSVGCSKSEEPIPEKIFKDVGQSMEDNVPNELPESYYNYFRIQNDSDHTIYFSVITKYCPWIINNHYIHPGEQATEIIVMDYYAALPSHYILIDDLTALKSVQFYFNAPSPEEMWEISPARIPNLRQDTCGLYMFDKTISSTEATPLDPSQWVVEKFTDHRIRWTYRVTNADHGVAVQQTLERWANWPETTQG